MSAIPFVPCLNTVMVQMCFLWDGQKVQNVYHVHRELSWTIEDMTTLAETFSDWWVGNLKNLAGTTFALAKVLVTDLTTPAAPGIEYAVGMPIAGTATDAMLPNNVALAVKWLTGLRGRSFRGRTYHMPNGISNVDNNTAGTAYLEALADAYGNLVTSVETTTPQKMVVVSKVHNGTYRTNGMSTEIVGLSIDPTMDSQRRRLPGRGE